ncbi:hypothetical protein BU15DRAFT_70479 [Melanogaster broomeanus]|nr:hypothetical protein BU15DRAFT_70479 [Melanogaster broomeanus]
MSLWVSDAPRSSIDSTASSDCSSFAHSPISPFSFPSTPVSSSDGHEYESVHLRSRWSCSTLASLAPSHHAPRSSRLSKASSARARVEHLRPPQLHSRRTATDLHPHEHHSFSQPAYTYVPFL